MDVRPNYYRRGGDLIDEWQREAADNRLAMAAKDARREARRRGRASGRQEWRLGRAASAVRQPLHALRASLHPRHASGVAR
jgi:hypothetical protein